MKKFPVAAVVAMTVTFVGGAFAGTNATTSNVGVYDDTVKTDTVVPQTPDTVAPEVPDTLVPQTPDTTQSLFFALNDTVVPETPDTVAPQTPDTTKKAPRNF